MGKVIKKDKEFYMQQVKGFLTTKEVTLIADILKLEEILVKKLTVNSRITMNEKLKKDFLRLSNNGKNRFAKLYSLL